MGEGQTYGSYQSSMTLADLDRNLLALRETMENQVGTPDHPFDYYDRRDEWKLGKGAGKTSLPQGSSKHGQDKQSNLEITPMDKDLASILQAMDYSHNIILYGPPGTGKTYLADLAAQALIAPQLNKKLSDEAVILRIIQDLTYYNIIALSMYLQGPDKHYTVPQIGEQKILTTRLATNPVTHPREYIWGTLQSHTSLESKTVKVSRRNEPFLFDKVIEKDESVWMLTSEGKEYVETQFPEEIKSLHSSSSMSATPEQFIYHTTFHQSYSYDDFIEGIRPSVEKTNGEITYPVLPGVFRRICQQATADPVNKYILVIDEINRGNIAKIFGELITILEEDKRGTSVILPYSGDRFSVPENIYVLGTMNSADRSIALLDIALRRRFDFIELMPRPDLLLDDSVEVENINISLADLLRNLNKKILSTIGCDYQIGHSYLLKVSKRPIEERSSILEFVWTHQIIPLLKEYYYSQPDKLIEILGKSWMEESSEQGIQEGQIQLKQLEGDELLEALDQLAKSGK